MNYKIKILDTAENDIINIYNFIFNNTKSKKLSDKIFYELYSRINSLTFMPEMYQIYIDKYRSINHKWYKIFYKINKKNREVIVYNILSQKQNYINFLQF